MELAKEIEEKRKTIHSDGYPMSIGELANLYRDGELDLHPKFQRVYRWSQLQKSKLLESLLLTIPIPTIFVQQREDGVWDVIDGVQRLSTIFEVLGILRDEHGNLLKPLVLSGTQYLPSLEGVSWKNGQEDGKFFTREEELLIKRAKLDIRIINRESDDSSKYELFQRLNSGGTLLTRQEFRNCLLIMVDSNMYDEMEKLAQDANFQICIDLNERLSSEQFSLELMTRFLVFYSLDISDLRSIKDLNEFLNEKTVQMAQTGTFLTAEDRAAFLFTFKVLAESLGEDSFRRYDSAKARFAGGFLISLFEVLALGIAYNYNACGLRSISPDKAREVATSLWVDNTFQRNSGSGVSASSRIPATIALGREKFRP